MLERLNDLKNFVFGIYGAGKTGRATARLLARLGVRFFLFDDAPEKVRQEGEGGGLEILKFRPALKEQVDLWIVSPGIPPTHPVIAAIPERAILSEFDLYRLCDPPFTLAVTGTNGKSTVVTWISHFLRGKYSRVSEGGNLGTPMLELLGDAPEIVVLEVSSFQLYYTQRGKVEIALLTNLAPNHLDWHRSSQEYADAKKKLFRFLGSRGIAILPLAPYTEGWAGEGRWYRFGKKGAEILLEPEGVRLKEPPLFLPYPPTLLYPHDYENFAMSAMASFFAGVSYEQIAERSASLPRLPHRLELVAEVEGRRFVNDSKSTTPHATQAAIAALEPPILLLVGGKEKGLSFEPYVEGIASRVKKVYAYGECRARLKRAFEGRAPVGSYPHLQEAFEAAVAESVPGDTILLSPGTSSFDEFHSYEERGARFRTLVEEWKKRREKVLEAREAQGKGAVPHGE